MALRRSVLLSLGGAALMTGACDVDITGGTSGAGAAGSAGNASAGSGGSPTASSSTGGGRITYPEVVLADHPVAYWRFEQVVPGGLAVDEVMTFMFDGTYGGTPSMGAPLVQDSGASMLVSGEGDGADMGEILAFAGSELSYSIEVWVRPAENLVELRPIVSNVDCCAAGWMLDVRNFDVASFDRNDPTSMMAVAADASPVSTAESNYIVGVYDAAADSMCLWLNALSDECGTGAVELQQDFGIFRVAINSGPNQFVGLIDELAIYDKALTAEQIQNHYAAGQLQQ